MDVTGLPAGGKRVQTPEGELAAMPAIRAALGEIARRWELWAVAGLALALTLVYLATAPSAGLPFDDSYISLLFARNLADHGFLTFDGEEASAGATSLLHVALLAIPIKAGVEPVNASLALGIALQVGLTLATYWLAWVIFRDRLTAALAGASIAVIGYLSFDALNGMETTLFLLVTTLAAASFFCARSERGYLAAGLLGALAVLVRPEGALLVAAMALYVVTDPERSMPVASADSARRLALLLAPTAAALFSLALFYYVTTGAFTPGTATAKMLFFREFEGTWQQKADALRGGLVNFIGPLLPWLVLSAFSLRRRQTLLFVYFWVFFIGMYFVLFPGGIGHYWYRYQHVFIPPIAVFGAAGLVALTRSVKLQGWNLVPAGIIGVVLLAAVGFQYNSLRGSYATDVRINETRQVELAIYLRDLVGPDNQVATHDIGTIGYFCDCEVIDLVGLVEPDVTDYHDGRRLSEYVDRIGPRYVVALPSWERNFLQLGLDDTSRYTELRRFPVPGREPFIVYERVDQSSR
jgi:hypothetical protein